MSTVDRRAVKAILALCDVEIHELAESLGYDSGYVSNVLTGATRPSAAFCRAFGDAVAELAFGKRCHASRLVSTGPLLELIRRRARYAARKRDFYSDHGINMSYLTSRDLVSELVVDRICSSLGVHPSAIYGAEEAS